MTACIILEIILFFSKDLKYNTFLTDQALDERPNNPI